MEIWKLVDGFDGRYEVSNLGNVRSLLDCHLNPKTPTIKVQSTDMNGYKTVNLYFHKKLKLMKVHRLVAMAFLPNPENKPQVNHKNGVKTDNNLFNLEWATRSENIKHSYDIGLRTIKYGEKSTSPYWKDKEVIDIKTDINKGLNTIELFTKYPRLNSKHLYLFRKNKTHPHLLSVVVPTPKRTARRKKYYELK